MQAVILALLATTSVQAEAFDKTKDSFEICMQGVLLEKPGQIVKVEKKLEDGMYVYEFDVRGDGGLDWDIECVQATGEVWEVEQKVQNPNAPIFKSKVKIGEKAAGKIALKTYPGIIREVDYEIESDGTAVYEFDIDTTDGREMNVEINATTGEIVEANEEIWQIGFD
ncbi:PepSY domain-containing protein [Methylophaga sp. OBS3]|uniref:PepSY domain-containing protein n=1 Tax=Methylophaga sp. OBS3 TaxID=2991934 RepID=UPI002258C460|nr:PepSY domain-containing protein [Methylophaga sp. OBS3]MCX4189147.1 PepSY domain-containing protein [Methylophaga sp. OBS3]